MRRLCIQLAEFPVRLQRVAIGGRAVLREAGGSSRKPFETGAHAASIEAVREGRADVCSVDCVTWALLGRYRPSALSGLRVLAFTERMPGLPFVTAGDCSNASLDAIRRALERAFARPELAETREALLIAGLSVTSADAYEPLLEMERAAAASGYPDLE